MLYSQCKVRRGEVLSLTIHTCRWAKCGYIVYVCLFVCLYSYENKASGVKFCTVVQGHPGQGIAHFGELCSPRSQKSNKSASLYIHTDICVCMWVYEYIYMYIFARSWDTMIICQDRHAHKPCVASACVDIQPSPKTDVIVLFAISVNNFICKLVQSHLWLLYRWS